MKKFVFLSLILACSILTVDAQETLKPRPSPLDLATFKYEDTYLKVTYSRPHKRGRKIFGNPELVPYDKVWRTGANEATEITITEDINMGGEDVPAGTYTLFSIPGEEEWTIILNKEVAQWGAYRYNEEEDLVRFTVAAGETNDGVVYEPFTIKFDQVENDVSLNIMWDTVMVSIPISFE